MKHMHKLLALFLAVLLTVSLAACGVGSTSDGDTSDNTSDSTPIEEPGDSADDAPETDAPETDAPETDAPKTDAPETEAPETDAPETDAPETEAPETDAPETEAPETDAPETDAPETDAPETEAPETDAPETDAPVDDTPVEIETMFGTISDLTYENDFIGIGFTLPESWVFYNDEQIRALNNVTADMIGDEYKAILENAAVFYDMFASDAQGLNSININFEKVNPFQLALLDIGENFALIAPTLGTMFENMGYTDFTYEVSELTIDGETFDCLHTSAKISGITLYQTALAIKCDGYLANITVATYISDTRAELLDGFYILK